MKRKPLRLRPRRQPAVSTGLATLASAGIVLTAGWILYSRFGIDHQVPLAKAVQADHEIFFSPASGRISYYQARTVAGRPLVLLHSINAAASAYEVSPLFNHFRGRRPVFAPDLPGYGFSERSTGPYTPRLFTQAIRDFLEQEVKEPADVVALSLSSEFAARAAVQAPQLFHSLTMISPTGLKPKKPGDQRQPSPYSSLPLGYRLLSFPLWGQAVFDLIASRASIEAFLEQNFTSSPPEGLVQYAYDTAHQPGAHYAPLTFISGALFTPNVMEQYYQLLDVPTLVLYDRDPYTRFDRLPELVDSNPKIEAVRVVNTLGLPHFEKLEETTQAMQRFWDEIPATSSRE